MKEKAITIILTILILVVPMAIMPSINNYYNIPKVIVLLLGGTLLLVFLLANYKKMEIDNKDVLLLIFGILIFISTMLSSNINTSILGSRRRYEGMLVLFTYILIYFCAKKFLNYKNKNNLLKVLYERGAIAYDKETKLYLPFNAVGVNQYGLPTQYSLVKYNGGVLLREPNQVVILRTNDLGRSIKELIDVNVNKLVDIDVAINQNLESIKTMTLVEVENPSTLLSFDNIAYAKRVGATLCFVNKGSGSSKLLDSFKAVNTGAQYLVDKLQENRRHILNEALSLLGVATANTEKRERVQSIEVLASQNFATDFINCCIDTFNYDAEIGNISLRLKGNTTLVKMTEIELKNLEKGDSNGK